MAKKAGTASPSAEGQLLHLDPETVLAVDNSRFGMRETGLESLKEDILKSGGIIEPVEVEPLETPSNGHKYQLVFGFRRHAIVSQLNKEGAGLTLPAILRKAADPLERIKRQLSENLERESLSPMDQAAAIKRLLDMNVPKVEVRNIFKRPGGRKGAKVQPASNSFINMTLSFLDLPKAIQEKIHSGAVGVAAAYELTKVPADKRAQVLERAEAERVRALDAEEKDEERFLANEKKAEEAKQKRDEAATLVEKASKTVVEAQATLKAKTEEADAAYAAVKVKGLDKDQKKAAEQAFAKVEQDRKVAAADLIKAEEDAKTLKSKAEKAEQLAIERLERLKAARSAKSNGAATKKSAVGPTDVKKAASEVTGSQPVPLSSAEMRKTVEELCLPGGPPAVILIGKAFRDCFAGITTDKQLYKKLAEIVS